MKILNLLALKLLKQTQQLFLFDNEILVEIDNIELLEKHRDSKSVVLISQISFEKKEQKKD